NSCYEKIRTIHNKHKGERCFIVATGPSLTMDDLEKLKGEISFSMNSICLAFDDTEWRPTYYGIQFDILYKELKEHIEKLNVEGIFVADIISNDIDIKDNFYIYPLNLLNHQRRHKKYNSKFSADAFAEVYDGYSITYSLIQIAVYMGFKEIYLLGVDNNYSTNMHHHFKDYGFVDPKYLQAGNKMFSAYKEAKKYADKHNIKIYNATRGGMLDLFERVDLDAILYDVENNKEGLKKRTV
ncbi:6-hydroxymethylpterin diphosphokinase MptE-like protein, partial [Bacillus sp. JJ1566]|uniref:6-hydroxymethylpterin diphosphokinase MptE-like protein n=1 Tax=Bacillus sp. JJ1566 TaxID=3122961 RepID=UPI0030004261